MLSASNIKLNFIISQQANFLHILDGMSLWDQHVNDTYLQLYKKNFPFTAADSLSLFDYAAARDSLGWDEETELFRWADRDFALDSISDEKAKFYKILKKSVTYFQNKPAFVEFLNQRYNQLPFDIIKVKAEVYMNSNLTMLENYLSLWRKDNNYARDLQNMPVYLFYAPDKKGKHGGANGDGIFAEFTADSAEIDDSDYSTLLHEAIHKLTRIKENLQLFLADTANYDKAFQKHFGDSNIRQGELLQVFKDSDPQTWGKSEDGILDEIFVYFCTPILTLGFTDQEIQAQAKYLKNKGRIEYARIWEAQTLLKKELHSLKITDLTRNEKMWSLIRAFYDRVYYKNL